MKPSAPTGEPPRTLPVLLDRKGVSRIFGLTRVDVERVFRALRVVSLDGSRKVYVRSADVERLIEESTTRTGEVRPIGHPAPAV
jgi:hypothetical protein